MTPPLEQERYWLFRLTEAIDTIERAGICRIDLDMPSDEEYAKVRHFLGVLQDYALGYQEDGSQPRLSKGLRRLLDLDYTQTQPTADALLTAVPREPPDAVNALDEATAWKDAYPYYTTGGSGLAYHAFIAVWKVLRALEDALVAAAARKAPDDRQPQVVLLSDAIALVQTWIDAYPLDVFPPDGTSRDCHSAAMGRHMAACLIRDLKELAARKESDDRQDSERVVHAAGDFPRLESAAHPSMENDAMESVAEGVGAVRAPARPPLTRYQAWGSQDEHGNPIAVLTPDASEWPPHVERVYRAADVDARLRELREQLQARRTQKREIAEALHRLYERRAEAPPLHDLIMELWSMAVIDPEPLNAREIARAQEFAKSRGWLIEHEESKVSAEYPNKAVPQACERAGKTAPSIPQSNAVAIESCATTRGECLDCGTKLTIWADALRRARLNEHCGNCGSRRVAAVARPGDARPPQTTNVEKLERMLYETQHDEKVFRAAYRETKERLATVTTRARALMDGLEAFKNEEPFPFESSAKLRAALDAPDPERTP